MITDSGNYAIAIVVAELLLSLHSELSGSQPINCSDYMIGISASYVNRMIAENTIVDYSRHASNNLDFARHIGLLK